MPLEFIAQSIVVLIGQELIRIPAQVCGDFAMHPAYRGPGMTVTHVPTGRYLCRDVPAETAEACIARALTIGDVQWHRSDVAYFADPKQRIKTAILTRYRQRQ